MHRAETDFNQDPIHDRTTQIVQSRPLNREWLDKLQ